MFYIDFYILSSALGYNSNEKYLEAWSGRHSVTFHDIFTCWMVIPIFNEIWNFPRYLWNPDVGSIHVGLVASKNIWHFLLKIKNNKRPTGLNGHLSIRDFTLNSCQKGAYLHINSPIIIINKNKQLYRKAAS